jgi:hypothetical protein
MYQYRKSQNVPENKKSFLFFHIKIEKSSEIQFPNRNNKDITKNAYFYKTCIFSKGGHPQF